MSFHEIRLPEAVERGARGGPAFRTTVLTLSSGREKRNVEWAQTRGSWDISYGIRTLQNLNAVIQFFYARQGRAYGFRFKDWSDHSVDNQSLATGDGTTTAFQLFKRYSDSAGSFNRELTKIVSGTGEFAVDGFVTEDWTLNHNTGIVTFDTAPPDGDLITFSCEFDVPVRFDSDNLGITVENFDSGSIPSIQLVEVRI